MVGLDSVAIGKCEIKKSEMNLLSVEQFPGLFYSVYDIQVGDAQPGGFEHPFQKEKVCRIVLNDEDIQLFI